MVPLITVSIIIIIATIFAVTIRNKKRKKKELFIKAEIKTLNYLMV